jgi:hypothetical protein
MHDPGLVRARDAARDLRGQLDGARAIDAPVEDGAQARSTSSMAMYTRPCSSPTS